MNVAIYFGGILLVACVIRVSAGYGWLSALLDPEAKDEPGKPSLAGALNGLAEQLTFIYGLVFTLLLIGLFLPAWIVLRRRAWQVVRTRNKTAVAGTEPPQRTLSDDQQWLEAHGLGFTNFQHAAQIFALLAPLGAGTVLTALKGFVGG